MKAIFFDNDGTLVDTEKLYFKATQQVLATVGVNMTREWFIEESLRKNQSSWSLLDSSIFSDQEVDLLRNKRNNLYSELLENEVELLPGVWETLEALHGKIVMGVVTTSRRQHFDIILRKTKLKKFFTFFIVNEDVSMEKPHPEPYLKALDIVGFKPEECMAVEDTERGLIAAKSAGISCYCIPTKLSQEHDFSKADAVMGSFSDLLLIPSLAANL